MKPRFDKIYLEITNACNLACSFCGLTVRERAFMKGEDFGLALERLQGFTKVLYFHLMGEPLLHPELPVFLDLAERRGFSVNLTTNGTLLARRGGEISGKPALNRLNISLQSMEQFPPAAREGLMDALVAEVKGLVARQRRVRPDFLASFRLWTRDDGTLTGPLLASLAGKFPDAHADAAGLVAQTLAGRNGFPLAEGIALHAAETFDWPPSPPPPLSPAGALSTPAGFCRGLRDQLGVLLDGTVVPCCLDRNGDIALGNLFARPLGEILDGPRARGLYRGFTERRAMEPLCAACTYRTRFNRRSAPGGVSGMPSGTRPGVRDPGTPRFPRAGG